MTAETVRVFRTLHLPTTPKDDIKAIQAIAQCIQSHNVLENEQYEWVQSLIEIWSDTGCISNPLKEIITAAISVGAGRYSGVISEKYIDIHSSLLSEWNFSHNQATWFLSHSYLMALLAEEQNMSCGQIARVLANRDTRFVSSWQSVSVFLQHIRRRPVVELDDVKDIFSNDERLEEVILSDADITESANYISSVSNMLGYPGENIERDLLNILGSGVESHVPYMQILHYQCLIADKYDHDLCVLYEFSPRGKAFEYLADKYPDQLVSARNPFLNNAKSVDRATREWARSKKTSERFGALSLVDLLSNLTEMGFPARRELCAHIRYLIQKNIRIHRDKMPVMEDISRASLENFLRAIAIRESNTSGILEQRVVDLVSSSLHRKEDGWIARGVGDSVNTTNISRKKLGDCDFQKPSERKVVAYEAHAGRLTGVYIDQHIHTLRKTIISRKEEWSSYSDPAEWTVRVVFLAHDIDRSAITTRNEIIEDVKIIIDATTYSDLISNISLEKLDIDNHLKQPLYKLYTPNSVRKKFKQMSILL